MKPKRPRRTGIHYVENDIDRSFTFIKRRDGLFKSAADLSILTGAKVAVVVESEREKMFAFGTPSAGPIIDSFLSWNVEGPIPHEVQKANTISLENKLVRLGNLKDVQDRRMRVSMARSKEIQESSKIAKLVYGEIDDLSVDELNELLHGLTRINQEIEDQVRASQIQVPPRHLPWTSVQPLQIPRSSSAVPEPSWLQSSLLNSTTLPLPQAPPVPPLQHSLMPQHPWAADMLPLPNEAHQYNDQSQQFVINGQRALGIYFMSLKLSSIDLNKESTSLTKRLHSMSAGHRKWGFETTTSEILTAHRCGQYSSWLLKDWAKVYLFNGIKVCMENHKRITLEQGCEWWWIHRLNPHRIRKVEASVFLLYHVEALPNGPSHLRTGEDNREELEGGLGRFEEE
ncbi:unnamed protein product [Miscanthus lutarioriparius]|uniref:MADS-box domain-containing protein n=1 Tax=Miscanthus lutarioriparius TaxID=422564 RepID=A0A811NLI5_9POAL|nr:unnamed protein product [Miscanthus lutarioriparius]